MTPDELRERALNAIGGENEPVVLALLRIGDLLSDMLWEMQGRP